MRIAMSPIRALRALAVCLSIAHLLPIGAESSSVAVQHSVATFSRLGVPSISGSGSQSDSDGVILDEAQISLRIPEILLSRKLHMPVRSRSFTSPKFGRIKGRKMLFGSQGCASQDLTLTQGAVSSTSGIPTFSVQIINLCGTCAMGAIHVACGNWASATPVDPYIFSRLGYNDCLVNNGKPITSQGSISFQYSNSAMYPMRITSASNECAP